MALHYISGIGRGAVLTEFGVSVDHIPSSGYLNKAGSVESYEVKAWIRGVDDEHSFGFESTVVLVDDDMGISQTMSASKQVYRGTGIPEASLILVRAIAARQIFSSTNARTHWRLSPELRTGQATKVWERLVKCGWAKYDQSRDRYYLP